MDNKHSVEFTENNKVNPIKTNYFPRTRTKAQPPPSPGIMLPAFKRVQQSDSAQRKASHDKGAGLKSEPKQSSWRNFWGWKPFG